MNNPLVSIILFSYNQSGFISSAIKSMTNQTYPNLEIIIVDNGSTDGSKEVINKYLGDPRIIFLDHKTNESVSVRHNEVMKILTGKYVSILYADDYYLLDKIQKQVAIFETLDDDYGLIYGPAFREYVKTNNKIIENTCRVSGWCFDSILDQWSDGYPSPVSPLARSECYFDFPADENIFHGAGEGLFMFFATKYKFYYVDEPLAVMRDHDLNAGKRLKDNVVTHHKTMMRLLAQPGLSSKSVSKVSKHLSYFKMNSAWHLLRSNDDTGDARNLYSEAILLYPKNLFHGKRLLGLMLCYIPATLVKFLNNLTNALFKKDPYIGLD